MEQELERLDRTVGVMQVAPRCREDDLRVFFERNGCGRVRQVRIVKDHRARVSKGIAYCEFVDLESVEKALQMTGQQLMGMPLIVQRTEAEKALLMQQMAQTGAAFPTGGDLSLRRLYVGNLHPGLTADDMRLVFEPFGPVEKIEVVCDHQGKSKVFADYYLSTTLYIHADN
jgi:RNA-binding protein 39